MSMPSPSAARLFADSTIPEFIDAFSLLSGDQTLDEAGVEVDFLRGVVLRDRLDALVAIAEGSPARSLQGVALKMLLAHERVLDLCELLSPRDLSPEERDAAARAEGAVKIAIRSAYKALAALGGELPAAIAERYIPELDLCTDLAAKGKAVRPH